MMSDNNKICTIYIIKNTVNKKVYIGQTWQPLHQRWNQGKGYNTSSLFWNAICKYDKKSFYYEILCEVTTQQEADDLEIKYIKDYKSNNRKYGYNIKNGGSRGQLTIDAIRKLSLRDYDSTNDYGKVRYFADENEKFTSKFEKINGCWLWKKALNINNEGRYSTNYFGERIEYTAHKFAYMYYIGEVPKDSYIGHSCNKNNCINPDHLFLITKKEFYKIRGLATSESNKGNQYGKGKICTEEKKEKIGKANRGSKSGNAILNEEKVKTIKNIFMERKNNNEKSFSQNKFFSKIAVEYGVSRQAIADIWYGKRWAHII